MLSGVPCAARDGRRASRCPGRSPRTRRILRGSANCRFLRRAATYASRPLVANPAVPAPIAPRFAFRRGRRREVPYGARVRDAQLTQAESPINSRGYGFFRLTAAELMGRPAYARAWLFRPAASRCSREPTQDNSTSSAVCSARLGSPLALQRRAHPGGSGWIPARMGAPGPPAFVFPDCAFPLALTCHTTAAAIT